MLKGNMRNKSTRFEILQMPNLNLEEEKFN